MNLIIELIYQLLSYGFWWFAFIAIACLAAKNARGWVLPLGHLVVAMIILSLDVAWIRREMAQPGWSPENGPDMDILFAIGMIARILLVNLVLLPLSIIVLSRSKKPRPSRPVHRPESGPESPRSRNLRGPGSVPASKLS